jgi:hypothetical protein
LTFGAGWRAFTVSATRVAAISVSASMRSRRRLKRSASTPPRKAMSSMGTNSATPSRPTITDDLVSWYICTGSTTYVTAEPKPETAWPA